MKANDPTVLFCDKHYDKTVVPTKLRVEDLNKKFGFEYMIAPSLRESFQSCVNYVSRQNSIVSVPKLNILDNPEESIVIHKTCETMGWGLAAVAPIQKGTVVLEYLGEVSRINNWKPDSTYTVCLDDSGVNADIDKALFISALDKGN